MPEGTSTAKRLRPSPSIIISIFSLIIAMSSGAYAAVTIAEKNSVVSKSIKNKNVKSADIKPAAVKTKHLGANSVDSSKIVDGQVGASEIADGQVGAAEVADGSLGTGDLSAAAKTDLNDASTLGGLTIAQIVAASGGEYIQATQQGGSANVLVPTASAPTVATLNIPHAGKWLINARIPVTCTWDGTGTPDPEPDEAGLNQPYLFATGTMSGSGAVTAFSQSENATCEAEAAGLIFIIPIVQGIRVIEFTRMITTTGAATVTLKAHETAFTAGGDNKVTATANDSMIQAITVQ